MLPEDFPPEVIPEEVPDEAVTRPGPTASDDDDPDEVFPGVEAPDAEFENSGPPSLRVIDRT